MFNRNNLFLKISITIILAFINSANAASIREKNYIHINAGYSHLTRKLVSFNSKKHDGAFVGGIGVGYIINPHFRTDITARYSGIYKHKDGDSTVSEKFHAHSAALMLNGYFNLKSLWRNYVRHREWIFPYVTAGIGYSINTIKDLITTGDVRGPRHLIGKKKGNIAWQIGLGTLLKVRRNINLDLSYRYVNLGKATTGAIFVNSEGQGFGRAPIKGKLITHEYLLGIIFKFN